MGTQDVAAVAYKGHPLTHHTDIRFSSHLNPLGFISLIIWRVHGFKSANPKAMLALDFPDWLAGTEFLASRPGVTLRLLGPKDTLTRFFSEAGLFSMLIRNGISIGGLLPIPSQVQGFVKVERNRRIERLERLLSDPSKVAYDNPKAEVTQADIEAARSLGMVPAHLAEIQRLNRQLNKEKKESIRLTYRSRTNDNHYILDIMRHPVIQAVPSEMDFSSYGLCRNASAVPYWNQE